MNEKPAALYARYSPRPETRKIGCVTIDMQLDQMRRYCVTAHLDIVHEFSEPDTSASKPLADRPEGAQLLRAIRSGEVTHIVAYSLDRLFRRDLEAIEAVEKWHARGIGVHILDWAGMLLDTTSPHGYLILRLTTAVAEYMRRDVARRTKDSAEHRQRARIAIGHPPYGWQRVRGPDGPDGRPTWVLESEPKEQAALAYMKLRAIQGATGYQIARECAEQGFPSRGKAWYHGVVYRALRRALRGIEPQKERTS